MRSPSTEWTEKVEPDEEERHAALVAAITSLQSRVNARQGPGRAFHRKQIAGLRGSFAVATDLPDHARQGLCSASGRYPAVIRMSNGAVVRAADAVPDIRGLAVSVRGVSGPGALGGSTDRQDLLFINRPAFGFSNSEDFAELVPAAARGQAALVRHLVAKHGYVNGLREVARLSADLLRPFTGFASSTFFTATPVQWGPYAVHLRLRPVGAGRSLTAWRDWMTDIAHRLADGPLQYLLEAAFFTDEANTPIEDGRVAWPGPWLTVGVLDIPSQDMTSDRGRALADEIEADRFDPWSALAAHRPLGEIMRARKAAYYPSAQNRTP